ncbi:glycosyltransferase [Corynebacterium sp. P5875]|uniref:Glycosyltransferase n=1 Tax=Corynebacterium antarcticum TaxID=2800405 RepID=A0A9Q4GKK1_9CORY|nr:glycosyltransferase [Corynebacterium antarcticum]MCX7538180.1 glycosyltransferase [Corynebacterium antarcticum]
MNQLIIRRADDGTTELSPVDVLLIVDSGYPFHIGGVGTVVDQLLAGNPGLSFGIVHLCLTEPRSDRYGVPESVRWIDVVPLVGTAAPRRPVPGPVERIPALLEAAGHGDAVALDRLLGYLTGGAPGSSVREVVDALASHWRTTGSARVAVGELVEVVLGLSARSYPETGVVHAQSARWAGALGMLVASRTGAPLVVSEHSLTVDDAARDLDGVDSADPVWLHWYRGLAVAVHGAADASVFLSGRAAERARGFGCRPRLTRIVPNGAHGAEGLARITSFVRYLSRAFIPACRNRLLCLARLVPDKGIEILVDAVARSAAGGREIAVDFIGPLDDPELVARCRERAERAGVGGLVRFEGTVAPRRLRSVITRYDALVLPSLTEGQPLAVLEAMACGVPVVATAVGDVADLVAGPGDQPAGPVVPPGSVTDLVEALETLTAGGPRYRGWVRGARRRGAARPATRTVTGYRAVWREIGLEIPETRVPSPDEAPRHGPVVPGKTPPGRPADRGAARTPGTPTARHMFGTGYNRPHRGEHQ